MLVSLGGDGARQTVELPDEGDWVRKARSGDRVAFAMLVDRYWDRLRRWLYGLTGAHHIAEELTQEAFFRAWISLETLHADGTFRVWLFRIARNCMLDSKRGPRGIAPRPLPDDSQSSHVGPLTELLERESQQLLEAALARLPTLFREAYLLWTQEELPYGQIAQILGITEPTARWRVCRARQFLLSELKAYLEPENP